MKLSNSQIMNRLEHLKHLLDHKDIVGYAAARNTRLLSEAAFEFVQKRDELIAKYGDAVFDDNGNETGEIALAFDSDKFPRFLEDLKPYAEIEQEINLVTLKYEQAIGLLSGTELLELDWMFED